MEGLTSEKVEVRGKHVHFLRRGCGQEVLVVIVMLVLMLVNVFAVTNIQPAREARGPEGPAR